MSLRRPLPKEMLHYARSDTHYLLSIYDRLRLALHEKASSANSVGDGEMALSPLEEVYRRSMGVSSITFSLPPFDHETGHFDSGFLLPLAKHGVLKAYSTALAIPTLPLKTGWGPSEGRFEVLRSVIRWREQTARDEDESGRYVLSLQGSLQLAKVGAAGGIKDANDVMRVLGGTRGGVSEVVRRRKDELAAVITETVERVRGNGGVSSAGGEEDVDMDGGAATSAITSAQLGLPAPEPAVRPIDGLWDAEPVASTSRSATTVVSVSVAGASAFFGAGTADGEGAGFERAPVVPVAASSSFFGPAKSTTAAAKNKKGKSKARAADAGSESSTATRTEAVKRVHNSLVLGGGLGQVSSDPPRPRHGGRSRLPNRMLCLQSLQPKPIPTENTKSSATPNTDVVLPDATTIETQPDPPSALTADHTYVPLSGRIPKEVAPSTLASSTSHVAPKLKDSDVIVVSNLKDKPKKRRRQGSEAEPSPATAAAAGLISPGERKPKAKKVKADSNAAEATAASASKPKKEKKAKRNPNAAPIVPYDYSASTSILDADPAASSAAIADKKERKRQAKIDQLAGVGGKKKGFEIDLSDFRRAPRVANAPKKANVSRSFAK